MNQSFTILYDADCGFCTWCRRQIENHARDGINFRFVDIKGPDALHIAQQSGHTLDQSSPESFVLIDQSHVWYEQSQAVYMITKNMNGLWRILSIMIRITPQPIADWVYRLMARHRSFLSRLVGQKTCRID